MESSNFTAKDISVIIKACKSSGVKSLNYNGLDLSFDILGDAPEVITMLASDSQKIENNHQEIEEDESQELRDLELQNLMISDPVAYEKHMRYEDDLS